MRRTIGTLFVTLSLATAARADLPALELDHGLVQTSLGTVHFDSDPEHNDQQNLIGIELHNPDRWFAGAAWFRNSFDQPSWYFYAGREFPLWQPSKNFEARAKLTGGLLHGYDGDKQDNIPLNHFGIAPAVLPTLGARWGPIEADVMVFGTAGMMATAGIRF